MLIHIIPKDMKKNYVISAAGGNNTAIAITDSLLNREQYETLGSDLLGRTEKRKVEQTGFLIPSKNHFEMSGGEFCGNAARSAAFLLSKITGKNEFKFTISGFDGKVEARVDFNQGNSSSAFVSCDFCGMETKVEERDIGEDKIFVVDLGGIVHCLLYGEFPKNSYKEKHAEIIEKLNLKDRLAVGVIWLSKIEDGVKIDPVVWVKSINTFFYETSCGSGSIAASVVANTTNIMQPSGQFIRVKFYGTTVQLSSVVKEEASFDDFCYIILNGESKIAGTFFNGFSDIYIKSFSGIPYFESYDSDWVFENVWKTHLKDGVIVLALEGEKVVGVSCSMPLVKSISQYNFINSLEKKPFDPKTAIYMSELAVDSKYRCLGIGSQLVKERLKWAKERNFSHFVMRTAAVGSNSLHLYKRIGASEISQKQKIDTDNIEIETASTERIYLYGDI